MKAEELIKEFIKEEVKFCKETGREVNKHEQFIYLSDNGKESFNLPYLLLEYKQWLIEKNIVKVTH